MNLTRFYVVRQAGDEEGFDLRVGVVLQRGCYVEPIVWVLRHRESDEWRMSASASTVDEMTPSAEPDSRYLLLGNRTKGKEKPRVPQKPCTLGIGKCDIVFFLLSNCYKKKGEIRIGIGILNFISYYIYLIA